MIITNKVEKDHGTLNNVNLNKSSVLRSNATGVPLFGFVEDCAGDDSTFDPQNLYFFDYL